MTPTEKSTFTSLSNLASRLVMKEQYKEALLVCERILEMPQFSLRARLLKATCLLKLNKNAEYCECLEEAKAAFPGCFRHIQEFELSFQNPKSEGTQNEISFGALFKTFKGWEEIHRQLKENWESALKDDVKRGKTTNESGAGDLPTDAGEGGTKII
jgi:hypothetical protein